MHYTIWVSIMLYIITNLSWWMTCFYITHLIYLSIGYFVLTNTCTCASWWMMCTYTTHTHNFLFVFVLCRYSHILVNLSIPRVDETSSWEQRCFGIPWTILTTVPFAQGLRAYLLLGSHTAMGYLPLATLCPYYRVHFAWYACFYAFAMQLWPLLAFTHVSPLCYFYVYLHAWWRP